MSRGLALPGTAACMLAAVIPTVIGPTACGDATKGGQGTLEVGTTGPAAAPRSVPPSTFASIVSGPQYVVRPAPAAAEIPTP
ncbi:hypothetical protein [Embleya hyalina]|uniref:Lipoprotein n=1 Tax=Embleya hyalina TaxID=516124 RepID=A0A401YU39_9ACTN|nr:hypothetical protein [Embleya hyalina]GCD98065.1 hypothetical protein EHYA_05765 [Embleya hyalina]